MSRSKDPELDGQGDRKNQGIQVITRAADILRLLGQQPGGLSLGQIARRVDLPRSTVQRIVSALSHEGFISSEKGYGGFRLGPEIQSLANASNVATRERIFPVMKSISEKTGETVDLAILDGSKMLFVDQVVGSHRLRTVSSIGESFPLTTTANGKAALACLDPVEARKLVAAEVQGRPEDIDQVMRDIAEIGKGQLAVDQNEHTDGICALGFAFKDVNGDVFAISVPVPSSRYEQIRPKLQFVLAECRAQISD